MYKITKIALATTGLATIAAAYAIVASNYSVDGQHSSISFAVPVAGGLAHLQGRFNRFTAQLNYVPNDYVHSSIKAVIDVNSLDTGVPGRDKHTLGPEGFDVVRYPQITFASTKIVKTSSGFEAIGYLSMKGVRKQVDIPFHSTGTETLSKGVTLLGFEGSFQLNRRDYGLKWEMPHAGNWIGDSVIVTFSVIARPS